MGRKRKIPKQSKQLKYFYMICVNFRGEDTLKFGISNNVWRRMREYNNSDTVGFLKYIKDVYKCSNPKRLELILKYYLSSRIKSIDKMEYFEMQYYDMIKKLIFKLSKEFQYKLTPIDYEEEHKRLLNKK